MQGFPQLRRYLEAQEAGHTYTSALAELRAGRKTSHWMWFVFPQIAGLGQSATSRTYAIASLEEAQAYLEDPVLGARLAECAGALLDLDARDATEIFGAIDAMKLRSSMTLFARAAPSSQLFEQILAEYFDGSADPATETILDR